MNRVVISLLVFFIFVCLMISVSASTWTSAGNFCVDGDCGESNGNINNPNGCCVAGDSVWVCGDGKFVQYNKSTGAYISSFNYAHDEGICWNGTHLWCVDGDSAYLISTTGSVVSTIANLPGGGDCRGIAYDGSFLWVASRNSNAIYQCKTDGTLLRTIDVSGHTHNAGYLDGLTWDGTHVIYVSAVSNDIVVVDMSDDSELDNFDPGSQSYALAYDASTEIFYRTSAGFYARVYYYTYPYDTSAFEPSSVTNETYTLSTSGTSADITINWTKGLNSNYTLIRKGTTTYPTSIYDGEFVYFGTGTGVVDSGLSAASVYTLWSYNSSGNWYGDPVYLNWTASWINVYNESDNAAISNWNIEISNSDGSQVYSATNCNNSLIVNLSDLPTGDDIRFTFTHDWYDTRTYVLDVEDTISLDAFLVDSNSSLAYLLNVIDDLSNPVGDAKVIVKREINDSFTTVASMLTDANGDCIVYLKPDVHYIVTINKSGYDNETADFTPTTVVQTKTFQISYSGIDVDITDWLSYLDITAEMTSHDILYMNYTDSLEETNSVNVLVERWNGTDFNETVYYYNSSSDTFTNHTNVNSSYGYRVNFTIDHDTFGTFTVSILVNVMNTSIADKNDIEDLLDTILGDNDLGWINLFSIIILCACLFKFGEDGVGLSLLGTGFTFLFLNALITGFMVSTLLPILWVVLGILVEWRDARRRFG